ncbi:MAG: hypothetical protein ACFHU9_12180 [Fluviicola sp.]
MNYLDYAVDDIIGENCERLFILESPHCDELDHLPPVPAVGKTGRIMSETLGYSSNFGLGQLIHNKEASKEGIINSSRIPLQRKAYKGVVPKELEPFMRIREVSNDMNCEELSAHLSQEDFKGLRTSMKRRFDDVINKFPVTQIIICGKIASAFVSASIGIKPEKVATKETYTLFDRDIDIIWARHPANKQYEWNCFCKNETKDN